MSGRQRGPAFSEVIEGRPIRIRDRELVPLVRVTSWVKRGAALRGQDVGAHGYGFVHLKPVGVVERDGASRRQLAIHDRTCRALWVLAVTVFLVPWVAVLLVYLARRSSGPARPNQSA